MALASAMGGVLFFCAICEEARERIQTVTDGEGRKGRLGFRRKTVIHGPSGSTSVGMQEETTPLIWIYLETRTA